MFTRWRTSCLHVRNSIHVPVLHEHCAVLLCFAMLTKMKNPDRDQHKILTYRFLSLPKISLKFITNFCSNSAVRWNNQQTNREQNTETHGRLHSNTVIGTLAVDRWAVTFGTARRGLDGLGPRPVPSSLYCTVLYCTVRCKNTTFLVLNHSSDITVY